MVYIVILAIIALGVWQFSTTNKTRKVTPSEPDELKLLDLNTATKSSPDPVVLELEHFCVKDNGYHISVWPKDQRVGEYLEFTVAGITHSEHAEEHLGEFTARIEAEPTNPYDPQAIRIVTAEGHQIGYVPRDQTQQVRDFTSLPCACYCYIGQNGGILFTDCYITI